MPSRSISIYRTFLFLRFTPPHCPWMSLSSGKIHTSPAIGSFESGHNNARRTHRAYSNLRSTGNVSEYKRLLALIDLDFIVSKSTRIYLDWIPMAIPPERRRHSCLLCFVINFLPRRNAKKKNFQFWVYFKINWTKDHNDTSAPSKPIEFYDALLKSISLLLT